MLKHYFVKPNDKNQVQRLKNAIIAFRKQKQLGSRVRDWRQWLPLTHSFKVTAAVGEGKPDSWCKKLFLAQMAKLERFLSDVLFDRKVMIHDKRAQQNSIS